MLQIDLKNSYYCANAPVEGSKRNASTLKRMEQKRSGLEQNTLNLKRPLIVPFHRKNNEAPKRSRQPIFTLDAKTVITRKKQAVLICNNIIEGKNTIERVSIPYSELPRIERNSGVFEHLIT